MTVEEQVNQTKVLEGPIVVGQRTVASIFSTDELRQTAFLPSLFRVVNRAYYTSETSIPELGMRMRDRLGNIDELFTALRDDPESFTVIISHPASEDVIGTASVRRYDGPSPEGSTNPWLRSLQVEPNTEEWELKLMSTDPVAQKCGVATFMVDLMEKEIVRRHHQKSALVPGSIPKRARLVLCTPSELFGQFYHRRGYQTDYEKYRGEGQNFHIVFMSKVLYDGTAVGSNGA